VDLLQGLRGGGIDAPGCSHIISKDGWACELFI